MGDEGYVGFEFLVDGGDGEVDGGFAFAGHVGGGAEAYDLDAVVPVGEGGFIVQDAVADFFHFVGVAV